MAIDVTQNIQKKFSFKNMQELMNSLKTFNCESQAVAFHGTATDLKSTGTKGAFINGQIEVLEADTKLDLGGDDAVAAPTAWATATAYTLGNIRAAANGIRIRCIDAHTSLSVATETLPGTAIEPFITANWDQYWEIAPNGAVDASSDSIAALSERWYMITANAAGAMQIWEAGDVALNSAGAVLKVPQTDPKLYVPVALMLVYNSTSSAIVLGTVNLSSGATTVITNVTGQVLPHSDNWDKN